MKISMYFHYTWRALLRGGQRTILAIFCVAIGVMAVVALQLVALMLQNSLTSNVRAANGGDIAVSSSGVPLKASDLTFFDQLKSAGTITNYTAVINANGAFTTSATSNQSFTISAVDPSNYPLTSQPTFVSPASGNVSSLLGSDQVIVTQSFLDKYQKQVGDTLTVYVKTTTGTGETLTVKIAGVIANSGQFIQSGSLLLISNQDYLAGASAALASYNLVDVTTANQTQTNAAVKAINNKFQLATTQTVADLLKSEQSSVDLITKFLEVSGLLALLIGGVGIVNTMQVLLSRRKTEIAMLKTSGYKKRDLYLLFGLEAGLLGLIGGVTGAVAATGVSYIIRDLMVNIGLNVLFTLDPWTILRGVGIGFLTTLIFGLMPIVQAAIVRPLQVIRELENRRVRSGLLTVFLLIVISLLFCFLAIGILNNDVALGISATYGTLIFLLILSAVLSLIILAISKLPVPEHIQFKQVLLVLVGLAIAALFYRSMPVFSYFLLAAALLGLVVTFLPRDWKVSIKMALRSIGRRRTRTMETMLALFIGIFGIGLVIGLALDVQKQVTNALTLNEPYNVVATTTGADTNNLRSQLSTISGLSGNRQDPFVSSRPVAINGLPAQQVLPTGGGLQQATTDISGIEGYNLTQALPAQTIIQGRNLNASDANTNNVLVSQVLTSGGWVGLKLKPGDTITFASADGKVQKTVTVVGIISTATSYETLGFVLAPADVVNALNSGSSATTTVFYLKVAPAQVSHALNELSKITPNATVQNLSDAGTTFLQQLDSILDLLIAVSLLSLIAAIIIIANAVALAMLERRRELGILKSVGYTSTSILSEIVIENGIVGAVSGFIAMLLAASVVGLLGKVLFNLTISMEPIVVVSMITGGAVLAMLTAVLVAWEAVRVRPLEVLKYE